MHIKQFVLNPDRKQFKKMFTFIGFHYWVAAPSSDGTENKYIWNKHMSHWQRLSNYWQNN